MMHPLKTLFVRNALLIGLLIPAYASAHGAHSKPYGGEVRAYVFEYALGEPLRRGEVSVFPPDSDQRYVSGLTDGQGVFAFAPDRPGAWRLEVRDGKGHAIQRYVRVGGEDSRLIAGEASQDHAGAPPWMLLMVAISLLLNAWLGLLLLQRRRMGESDAPKP